MRRVELRGEAALDKIMNRLHPVHAPVVVAVSVPDAFSTTFLVYYEPHTNFRLEDWGEEWDENGGFVR